MKLPIYLDYAATTPVDPRVAEQMQQCLMLAGNFGNPASLTHCYGQKAHERVEQAREYVAELINADVREIIWTSGATEADNLAIKGVAEFYQHKGKHIITLSTEHKAVLDACTYLQQHGFEVTYLQPESNGLLDLDKLAAALRDDTILVSVMHVNNEIGVIQDIQAVGKLTRERGVLLHVDAAQSAGKIPIDVQTMNVDLMSFAAHKIYGPKGIGALYVRRKPRARLHAQIHGGGHEQGLRSGTLATHQIVGMGEAFRLAKLEMAAESQRLLQLRDDLYNGIMALGDVQLNGDLEACAPGYLNVSFPYVDGEALLLALSDLALSSGSACTTASIEPSHVLKALGCSDRMAHNALRISLGRFTTQENVDYALGQIREQILRLREISPLWQG